MRAPSVAALGIAGAALCLLSACALIVGLNDALPRQDALDTDADAVDAGPPCPQGSRLCFSGSICESLDNPQFGCGDDQCNQCHPPHAQPSTACPGVNGQLTCNVPGCLGHWADCNNQPSDGCEADESQAENCFGCDGGCSAPTPLCSHAGGGPSCVADCGDASQCGSGCVNKREDPDNCGACNHVCAAPDNSTAFCAMGTCGFTCNDGSHACGSPPTSCQQDQDPLYCGKDCINCAHEGNSVPSCQGGVCTPKCNDGFGDCKVGAGDGCETNLQNDVNNCGACGRQCADTQNCCAGNCQSTKCLQQAQPEGTAQPAP